MMDDRQLINSAIAAAVSAGETVWGTTSPNPPVGAAIVDAQGALIATGATEPAGGAHAEVVALRRAGDCSVGATLVVTLEPCGHTGRTGPCTQAILSAGISRVVYLTRDPNPIAAGGADFLARHGVKVDYYPQPVAALHAWLGAVHAGRPYVTLKCAQTLDGFTAAADGTSQWITSAQSRRHVHHDRVRRDAIMIGTGTAIADNPSLTARDDDGVALPERLQPRRVVIGTRRIDKHASNLVRIGYSQFSDIDSALRELWNDGVRDVLVEGGAHLAGSMVRAGVVDEIRAYVAPMLLGGGQGVVDSSVADTLADAQRYELHDAQRLGPDVVLTMRRDGPWWQKTQTRVEKGTDECSRG